MVLYYHFYKYTFLEQNIIILQIIIIFCIIKNVINGLILSNEVNTSQNTLKHLSHLDDITAHTCVYDTCLNFYQKQNFRASRLIW